MADGPSPGDSPDREERRRRRQERKAAADAERAESEARIAQARARRAAALADVPLVSPSADNGLLGVVQRRYLLKLLVEREVNARYHGSALGMLWSYINPLSQFVLYYVVMGMIAGIDRMENFAIHVFTGLVVVTFFTETLNSGTRAIMRNKSLVQKMAMPLELFPVASVMVSLYHAIPELVILLVAIFLIGWHPDPTAFAAFLLCLAILVVLGLALALLLSVANVFMRDMAQVVNVVSNFIRFGTPMMYPYTLVAERFAGHVELYLANPITIGVLLAQRAFWVPTTGDPAAVAVTNMPDQLFQRGFIALGVSLAILLMAQVFFSRWANRVPERLG